MTGCLIREERPTPRSRARGTFTWIQGEGAEGTSEGPSSRISDVVWGASPYRLDVLGSGKVARPRVGKRKHFRQNDSHTQTSPRLPTRPTEEESGNTGDFGSVEVGETKPLLHDYIGPPLPNPLLHRSWGARVTSTQTGEVTPPGTRVNKTVKQGVLRNLETLPYHPRRERSYPL